MAEKNIKELAQVIADKAKEFGADLAGIASVEELSQSPSHKIIGKLTEFDGVGTRESEKQKRGIVYWPEGCRSAIVIAVEHPIDKPEMDWWVTGNTTGNHQLIRIVSELSNWLEETKGMKCYKLPYHCRTAPTPNRSSLYSHYIPPTQPRTLHMLLRKDSEY